MSKVEFLLNVVSNIAGELVFAALAVAFGLIAMKYHALASRFGKGKLTPSPDGKSVASENNDEIYVIGRNGIKNISHNPAIDNESVWSPDSRWIAFRSNRDKGLWSIYVADIKTGKLALLTLSGNIKRKFRWYEDGSLAIDMGGSTVVVNNNEIRRRLA